MDEEELLALFEAQIGQLTVYKDEVPAGLEVLEQRVDNAGQWFPLLVGMVKDLLEQLRATIAQFLEEVAHVIKSHTPFVSLIVRAFDWLREVKQPVSNLAGTAEETLNNENIVYWKGEGWTTYDGKRDQQATALLAVADRATFVHGWLVEILQANIAYTTKVVRQLTALATEVIPIIAKAANPATAAAAVGDLKNLVVTVVQHRVEEYSDIVERLGAAVARTGAMVETMSDHKTFPDGGWPQAVA